MLSVRCRTIQDASRLATRTRPLRKYWTSSTVGSSSPFPPNRLWIPDVAHIRLGLPSKHAKSVLGRIMSGAREVAPGTADVVPSYIWINSDCAGIEEFTETPVLSPAYSQGLVLARSPSKPTRDCSRRIPLGTHSHGPAVRWNEDVLPCDFNAISSSRNATITLDDIRFARRSFRAWLTVRVITDPTMDQGPVTTPGGAG